MIELCLRIILDRSIDHRLAIKCNVCVYRTRMHKRCLSILRQNSIWAELMRRRSYNNGLYTIALEFSDEFYLSRYINIHVCSYTQAKIFFVHPECWISPIHKYNLAKWICKIGMCVYIFVMLKICRYIQNAERVTDEILYYHNLRIPEYWSLHRSIIENSI